MHKSTSKSMETPKFKTTEIFFWLHPSTVYNCT